jgi:hypothetical protein
VYVADASTENDQIVDAVAVELVYAEESCDLRTIGTRLTVD